MPFKKGESGNPKGKPPGTKNKVNREIRQRINDFLDDNFETIEDDLKAIEPRERVRFYIELLQFGLPKLKAIELSNDPDAISEDDLNIVLSILEHGK